MADTPSLYKIPEMDLKENAYNMKFGAEIWQYKQWDLSSIGGIVLARPYPSPQSFCVFGLAHMGVAVGDFVMVARDSGNNPQYRLRPNENDPLIFEAHETPIKDELIGRIKAIHTPAGGFARIEIEGILRTPYGEEGFPRPFGAVTKVLGYNRKMVSEKQSEKIEKAKKLYGSRWMDLLDDGAWRRNELSEQGVWTP